MKKILFVLAIVLTIAIPQVKAQSQEMKQLLLDIEKLAQFKKILSDMKKGYEILHGGYNTIKDISQGNFNLHKTFLDGLMEVSPTVKNYKKVKDIISDQLLILKEYKAAYSRFQKNGFFNGKELGYMSRVYTKLVNESLENLDDLATVITANKLRMSDDERLQAIDRIYDNMESKVNFLRHFNNNNSILAAQRAKEQKDVRDMRSIYGITK